jgi:hypothetical protein
MANQDVKFGFRPNVHQAGGCPNRLSAYEIASEYASSIFTGDLVRSDATNGGRLIELAPDGTAARVLGVFAGCVYTAANGEIVYSRYWPASTVLLTGTVATAMVYDDPNLELVAQVTTVAATDVGAAFEWQNGTGNVVTGTSGGYIDAAETGAPQIRIEGLYEGTDGIFPSEIGAFAKVRCRILSHEKAATLPTF